MNRTRKAKPIRLSFYQRREIKPHDGLDLRSLTRPEQKRELRRRRLRRIGWEPAKMGWSMLGQRRRKGQDTGRAGKHTGLQLAQGGDNRIEHRRAPGRKTPGGVALRPSTEPYLVHATGVPPWVKRQANRRRNKVARASRRANR